MSPKTTKVVSVSASKRNLFITTSLRSLCRYHADSALYLHRYSSRDNLAHFSCAIAGKFLLSRSARRKRPRGGGNCHHPATCDADRASRRRPCSIYQG